MREYFRIRILKEIGLLDPRSANAALRLQKRLMRTFINLFLIGIVTMLGTLPLLMVARDGFDLHQQATIFALLNLLGWSGVLNYIFGHIRHRWRRNK